jgi:AAA-like domain
MRIDDRFYLRRGCDLAADAAASSHGETVIIKAPRQMGKSSLLVRYFAKCCGAGKTAAYLDFQLFGEDQLQDYPPSLQAVAEELLGELKLDSTLVTITTIKNSSSLTKFIERHI